MHNKLHEYLDVCESQKTNFQQNARATYIYLYIFQKIKFIRRDVK